MITNVGSTTINNDGIHESCPTVVLDDVEVTVGELAYVLEMAKNRDARIQLMEHQKFQLIGVSKDLYVLAPLDWKGWDSDEADINGVPGGTTGS